MADNRQQLHDSYKSWLNQSQDIEFVDIDGLCMHAPIYVFTDDDDTQGQSVHTEPLSEEESETSEEGRLFINDDDDEDSGSDLTGNLMLMIKVQEMVSANPYMLTASELLSELKKVQTVLNENLNKVYV